MASIEELKRTLADHADVPDDGLAGRAGAVAHRVRVVRRRRRTAVAAAAAAVVVAAGALAVLPDGGRDPQVAERVVGVDIPQEMTSLGRTYVYSHSVTAESGRAEVQLPPSDEPRLVSWATRGDEQRVTVERAGSPEDGFVSERPDFTDFVVVEADAVEEQVGVTDRSPVVIEGPGAPLGVAVYELAHDGVSGHTENGVTFRQQVGDRQLLAAKVGETGQNELSLTFTVGAGRHYLADWCTSSWNGRGDVAAWAMVSVDGEGAHGSGCSEDAGFVDPVPGVTSPDTATGLPVDARPGEEVTLTVRLTEDHDSDQLVEDDRAQLALGVYAGPAGRQVAGNAVDEVVEHDGHLWRLVGVTEGEVAPRAPLQATAPAGADRLLVGYVIGANPGGTTTWLVADGREGTRFENASGADPGGGGRGPYVNPGSDQVSLQIRGGSAQGAVLFYELVE